MNKIRIAHLPSSATLIMLALLFVFLTLMVIPSPVQAGEWKPPTRTTVEKGASSCTFEYVGNTAETCSGYSGFPCTCTINCPTCLQADDTCTGLSVVVINNICGNSGWQEADRFVQWHYYTVTTYRQRGA